MKLGINARFLLKDRLEGIGWFCHEVIRRMVARFPEHQFVLFFDRPFDPEFIYAGNVKGVVVQPPARHPVLWYLWFEYSLPAAMRPADQHGRIHEYPNQYTTIPGDP